MEKCDFFSPIRLNGKNYLATGNLSFGCLLKQTNCGDILMGKYQNLQI